MPCHHSLEGYLTAYLDGARSGATQASLTRTVLLQVKAMIGWRAAAAGIVTKLGNHSFRATGITAYLKNGGTLEKAAAHAATRTTHSMIAVANPTGPRICT